MLQTEGSCSEAMGEGHVGASKVEQGERGRRGGMASGEGGLCWDVRAPHCPDRAVSACRLPQLLSACLSPGRCWPSW